MAHAPYILGALYPWDNVTPPYTQPGGPGTQTFPAQTQGEMMGLFTAQCGHFFNSWHVQQASYVDDEGNTHTVNLVQCPLCAILVQIIDPFWLIYTLDYMYIIG